MRYISAHFDGEKVVLDEPVSLSTNTQVEVVFPDSKEDATRDGRAEPGRKEVSAIAVESRSLRE